MVDFKKKLSQFYGKSYAAESKRGGFFCIASGEFIKNNGYGKFYPVVLVFRRTDGKTRRTAAAKEQEKRNEKKFFENLERLGIILITPESDEKTFRKIADFFCNANAPKIKTRAARWEWAKVR